MNADARLTVQQIQALEELLAEAQAHGVDIVDTRYFSIRYDDESRPGRGHNISVSYIDGDHAVAASIDVYGNGDGAWFMEVDPICIPEEGRCEKCTETAIA